VSSPSGCSAATRPGIGRGGVDAKDVTAASAQLRTESSSARGRVEKVALGQRVVVECEHVAVVVNSAGGDRDGGGLVGHTIKDGPTALGAAFPFLCEAMRASAIFAMTLGFGPGLRQQILTNDERTETGSRVRIR
jgi:hypothetical protein